MKIFFHQLTELFIMSSAVTCANCNSSDIDTDQSRGVSYCTKCGTVIDENCIVSEVQFEEGNHGASHIIGQRHDAEGPFKLFGGISGVLGAGRESRQVTLINAKKKIKTVCDQLRLNDHLAEMSFNFYKMALRRNLTHGRKLIHVIAACIYITCRTEGTSHLLLDLSDVAQVNVYELGRTYLKLTSALCIKIPAIDPSLYIIRFAQDIELDNAKTEAEAEKIRHNVISTANRLVQRMKRDWIHYGRRPSGLCGAALLIAARLNGVHCSIMNIIKIVKVCETTIRKRLFEFSETPTSNLTLDEFMTIDLEGEEDPPCFKSAKRKLKNQIENEQLNQKDLEEEVLKLQQLIDKKLEESRKKAMRKGPYAKFSIEGSLNIDDDENETVKQFIADETVHAIEQVLTTDETEQYESYLANLKALRPTAASLGLSNSMVLTFGNSSQNYQLDRMTQNEKSDENEDDTLDLTGIDDDELDKYILQPHEVAARTKIWTRVHHDYLVEQKEKEERRAREEQERREKEASGEIQPRKKRKTKKKVQIQANTAGEAIEKMLQEKKISNKINYDVLKNLTSLTESTINTPVLSTDEMNPIREKYQQESPLSSPLKTSSLKRLTNLKNSPNISLTDLREPLFNKLRNQAHHDHDSSLKTEKNKPTSETIDKPIIENCISGNNKTNQDDNNFDQMNENEKKQNEEVDYEDEDYNDDDEEEVNAGLSIQDLLRLNRTEQTCDNEYEIYNDEDYDYD